VAIHHRRDSRRVAFRLAGVALGLPRFLTFQEQISKLLGAERGVRIVVTDCDHPDVEIEREAAADAGVELRLEQCRTEDEIIARCADADGLLVQYAPITARVLDALPHVQVISRYGVGVDTVDVDYASRRGVIVANAPHYGTEEVSDHALALLLTMARATARLDALVRAGHWDMAAAMPLHRIAGRLLGVIGFGCHRPRGRTQGAGVRLPGGGIRRDGRAG
jgi:D-3-phosphoglycerate dehydrogenase